MPTKHLSLHTHPAALQNEYEENNICRKCPVGSKSGDGGRGMAACNQCEPGYGKKSSSNTDFIGWAHWVIHSESKSTSIEPRIHRINCLNMGVTLCSAPVHCAASDASKTPGL
jgi:hypothetical protein